MPGQAYSLRNAAASEREFLWNLHESAMRDYVEGIYGWDDADQRRRFDDNFRLEAIQIIEVDGKPVGMWEVLKGNDSWFLARVALLTPYQNAGIGSALIGALLADANESRRVVFLQVLKTNPAKALYERLGFAVFEETETHFKMKKEPDRSS